MTTATFRRVQILDTHLDAIWIGLKAVLENMPSPMRDHIDLKRARVIFLQYQRTLETFMVDASARKHLLFVGVRRLLIFVMFNIL